MGGNEAAHKFFHIKRTSAIITYYAASNSQNSILKTSAHH